MRGFAIRRLVRFLAGAMLLTLPAAGYDFYVLDPNDPEWNYDGKLDHDPLVLAAFAESGAPEISGFVADEVTPLLLAFRADVDGCAEFIAWREAFTVGQVADVGCLIDVAAVAGSDFEQRSTTLDCTNPLTLPVMNLPTVGGYWAFAYLIAPPEFARDLAERDDPDGRRDFLLEVTHYRPEYCETKTTYEYTELKTKTITRPPVLLVHGLWSSRDTWAWPELAMDGTQQKFDAYWADYSPTNAASFYQNTDVVPNYVDALLGLKRAEGLAATQVDVVGHSMGGLLTRIYASGEHRYCNGKYSPYDYRRADNWQLGDVRKYLPLDSPHLGSEWANILMAVSADPTWGPVLRRVTNKLGMSITDGAVEDLQFNSWEITGMLEAEVASHALGSGGGSLMTAMGSLDWDIAQEVAGFLFTDVVADALDVVDPFAFIDAVFLNDDHDLVVSVTSQKGRLEEPEVDIYGLPWWHYIHMRVSNPLALALVDDDNIGVTGAWFMENRVVFLLDDPVTSSNWAEAMPGNSSFLQMPLTGPAGTVSAMTPVRGPYQPQPRVWIDIAAPTGGTTTAGEGLTVQVETSRGFAPDYVLVYSQYDTEKAVLNDVTGTYDAELHTPLGAVEPVSLSALALDVAGNLFEADDVTVGLDLPPAVALTGLTVYPDPLVLSASLPAETLAVVGQYTDGISRNLASDPATLYAIADPTVAAVDAAGRATALALGSTTLTVTHVGFQTVVDVEVTGLQGDDDGDGQVTLADFGEFVACFTGPWEDDGYQSTGNACLQLFDFDHDTDVDLDDFAEFLLRYVGPLGLDCNTNGIDDMDDLLAATSFDCDRDGIPDECGVDCNANGLADSCDVAAAAATLAEATEIATSGDAIDVEASDLDGDGDVDLAVVGTGAAPVVTVHLNDGGGNFARGVSYPVGAGARDLTVDDLDGDGSPDIAVATSATFALTVLTNLGDGTFSRADLPLTLAPWAVDGADIDADGDVDLVLAMASASVLRMLPNDGSGSFGPPSDYAVGAFPIAVLAGDVTGDGIADLASVNLNGNSASVLHNKADGSGTFWPAVDYPNFAAPRALALGDASGGLPELFVASQNDGTVLPMINSGAGYFFVLSPFVSGLLPMGLGSGDLNGDGLDEFLAVSWGNLSGDDPRLAVIQADPILFFAGLGGVVIPSTYPIGPGPMAGTGPWAVATGDVDGDGRLDAITANGATSTLSVLLNTTPQSTSTDRDHDGVPDECGP